MTASITRTLLGGAALLEWVLLSGPTAWAMPPPCQLNRFPANPGAGFHWPYYLCVPSEVTGPAALLVEGNNSRTESDDFTVHDEEARGRAQNMPLVSRLGLPVLVPAFPRPSGLFYPQVLDRDNFLTAIASLQRLDLQLIAMVDEARQTLAGLGIEVGEKILLYGYSASGGFASRFALLHPDRVQAAVIGSPQGWPLAPVASWQGETLRYPVGVSDLEELTAKPLDLDAVRAVPLYLFIGGEDTENDPIPICTSCYDPEDSALVLRLFGENIVERWPHAQAIYDSVGAASQFVVYPGVGHVITEAMLADVTGFFHGHRPLSFVEYLYQQFYGRTGDGGGVQFWNEQLGSGARSAVEVVESFFIAPEFQDVVAPMARLYFASFDRIPDAGGLAFWVGRFRGGSSLEQVAAEFIASTEFTQRFGPDLDDGAFVDLLYQNVLGRSPDPGGLAFWMGALDQGQSRERVLAAFSESAENRAGTEAAIRVTLAYQGMLGRTPSTPELSDGMGMLLSDLIATLLSSPDYAGPAPVASASSR